jgi:uncharacterized protein
MPALPWNVLQTAGELALRPAATLSPTFRQRSLLARTEHRPWELPDEPWFMRQTWRQLLFCHWPVPRQVLEQLVPPQLPIDSFDGSAWLGVTPFRVSGLRLRGTFPPPVISSFPEINVRTYVTVQGKPGIYFFSLDAARRSAVLAARRGYRLPYFLARMGCDVDRGSVAFSTTRVSTDGPSAGFAASYRPLGPAVEAAPGSLEYFLTERYCLYTMDERRRVLRAEIQHPPWPLQSAAAQITENTMASPFGLSLEGDPFLHFSGRQDVLLWPLRPASGRT